MSDKDELILEDETQRISLSGKLNVHTVVTGCVVAIYGKLHSKGIFEVEDYCWPEAEPIAKPLLTVTEDKYVVLYDAFMIQKLKGYVVETFVLQVPNSDKWYWTRYQQKLITASAVHWLGDRANRNKRRLCWYVESSACDICR